jgi:hypothetical protein
MTTTPPPPPPPSGPPGQVPVPSSGAPRPPVALEFQRDRDVQNWRPLVNWLLAIPHFIVLYVLGIAAFFVWIASFFTVLFTQRNPFVGFQSMVLRYQWRVTSYAMFMRNEYPPFDFAVDAPSVQPDAAVLEIAEPGDMNRWMVLVKWFLAIPHLIVLAVLGIGVFVVWIIAFFVVLFTGAWPESMRRFVIGYQRWTMRVNAYLYFLTDAYPPFSLD